MKTSDLELRIRDIKKALSTATGEVSAGLLDSKRSLDKMHTKALEETNSSQHGFQIRKQERICSQACTCRCHHRKFFSSPAVLQNPFGRLMVKTSDIKAQKCNVPGCISHDHFTTSVSYIFPYWFARKGLQLRLSNREGPELMLKVHPIAPKDSDVFRRCSEGDLKGLRTLLESRQISPDVIDSDFDTLLHVSNRPFPITMRQQDLSYHRKQ